MLRVAHAHHVYFPATGARNGNIRSVGRNGDEFGYRDDDGDIRCRAYGNKPLHETRTLCRDAGFRGAAAPHCSVLKRRRRHDERMHKPPVGRSKFNWPFDLLASVRIKGCRCICAGTCAHRNRPEGRAGVGDRDRGERHSPQHDTMPSFAPAARLSADRPSRPPRAVRRRKKSMV
jgi:hypothetical protein